MSKIDIEKIRKEKKIQELIEFGIINMDKPSGPTSFKIDMVVKKALGLGKTSHFGTLDPKVTGVLPIALGRACRLLGYFMKKDKTYVGVMRIHEEISREKVEGEMKKFVGKIMQLPPVKSRVKREEREREVYYWNVIENDGKDYLFEVKCEAGTYIRKLIHDLGEKIGGAHMTELRRTDAGIFSERDSNFINLYDFDKAVEQFRSGDETRLREIIIPGEIISEVMPVVQVKEECIKRLHTGSPIFKDFLKEKGKLPDERFAAFLDDKFIGIYKIKQEGNILAVPEFVFN